MDYVLSGARRGLHGGGEADECAKAVQMLQDWNKRGRMAGFSVHHESLELNRLFWVFNEGVRVFKAYGEVLIVDATCKTNR